ncbi:hypothetical protein SRM_p61032 (plasmid) [Salinibacter ruber M8]|uniref:Uncharacterized protein n=1 Tax=Salinibacter ruber (strain M8) TaxID=761659 RepID=D5H4E8_SALRM|nr:hypothetical protein SRM_p61032 [Salinibacter ruber M8]
MSPTQRRVSHQHRITVTVTIEIGGYYVLFLTAEDLDAVSEAVIARERPVLPVPKPLIISQNVVRSVLVQVSCEDRWGEFGVKRQSCPKSIVAASRRADLVGIPKKLVLGGHQDIGRSIAV